MCGIVGAIAERDVVPILLEGLCRLEYRGYDSAGIAVLENGVIERCRTAGRVQQLVDRLESNPLHGQRGIAHTRWATHGAPTEDNAHPHMSSDQLAIVHNGIVENHDELRDTLKEQGYKFVSDTDTEVVAHLIHSQLQQSKDLLAAVQAAVKQLRGAFALVVSSVADPDRLIAVRCGCPVVLGLGIGENFIASDIAALLPVTRQFMFLDEGDIADVERETITVYDSKGKVVDHPVKESELSADAAERGEYRHFMLKEIFEQPRAIAETLEERTASGEVLSQMFGHQAPAVFAKTKAIHIIACGTSFHAALVAKYFIEQLAKLPCTVEIASEYRYREPVVADGTLFVTISQSGETLDTLEALRLAKKLNYVGTLGICNVPESALVRESDLVLMTRAGPEIGVASTKAFTTQITALLLLAVTLAKQNKTIDAKQEHELVSQLISLPGQVEKVLELDSEIEKLAERFVNKHHALFLGRGVQYPIAMEGALKLKEISYIHAEAYAAGELKHGPLALVDDAMPVVAVAPNNQLLDKLKGNLQEVRARGGELLVFADPNAKMKSAEGITVIPLPVHGNLLTDPVLYTIPLQLLSYHVAVLKGTDVDKPRNLAKSVTVE